MKAKDDVKERLYFEMMSVFTQDHIFLIPKKNKQKKKAHISLLPKQQIHIAPIMIEVNVGFEAVES